MTDATPSNKPELTLIRGGKTSAGEFNCLPLPDKISRIRQAPSKKRLSLILDDPEGKQLTRALKPQELYWTFKDIGATDALELLTFASPEQRGFFLDIELWERSSFSRTAALEWLGYLLLAGEETIVEQLPHLDLELLLLILCKEITVGGGVGELLPDDERTTDWDHTFDNLYFISFKNPKNSRLIGTFLDIVYRVDRTLYQSLMEGVKNEVESELEDEAFAFRTGRLADLGFPSREEAVFIYARIDPGSFVPAEERKILLPGGGETLPTPLRDDTLLARALRRLGSDELILEFNYLINSALVVDETSFADSEAMQAIMQRVSGYVCIALEFLCGDNEEQAGRILERESLKRLFQLGHSIVQGLKKKAGGIAGDDHATGRALAGLKAERPKFYRGLDDDRIDGYREFSCMEDVRIVEEFLELLGG
jgi:hypothetical protein